MRAGGQAMHDPRPPAIALMGPTASGKSALAMDWARRLDGEIVSVDSALVYRGLDVGRSEEHTSELQSLMRISYAVFCLKKKKKQKNSVIPSTLAKSITR